jgi:hypothetical protein
LQHLYSNRDVVFHIPVFADAVMSHSIAVAMKRFWRGEETLARSFWLWGILGNLAYVEIFLFLIPYIASHDFHSGVIRPGINSPWQLQYNIYLLAVICIFYMPFSLVGFFRSSAKSSSMWVWPARIVAGSLGVVGFYLLSMLLRILSEYYI